MAVNPTPDSETGALDLYKQGEQDANAAIRSMGGPPSAGAHGIPASSPSGQAGAGNERGPGTQPFAPAPGPSQDLLEDYAAGRNDELPGITAPAPSNDTLDKAADQTEDNGEIGWQSFKHFIRDTFKGTGAEVANALPRLAAKSGGWLADAGAGIAFLADKSIQTARELAASATGTLDNKKDYDPRLADSVFNFEKDYIQAALEYWTPPRAAQTGQGDGSGGTAQAIGENAAPVGVAAVPGAGAPLAMLLTSMSFQDAAKKAIEDGQDVPTAVSLGTIDAVANWIQMKAGVIPSLPMLKRVITSIGIGDTAHIASQVAKKVVLNAHGYTQQADEIDPTDGLDDATLMNAGFGAVGGHSKESKGAKPKPAPNPSNATVDNAVQPPPSAAVPAGGNDSGAVSQPGPSAAPQPSAATVQAAAASAAPSAAPVQVSKVPDIPSAEPSKDLRAQLKDMYDKNTPRTGVFLSRDNLAAVRGAKNADATSVVSSFNALSKSGRTIDLPNGVLLLRTKADADAARKRIAAGEDPQSVIGSTTGAGGGKSPDQTVAVQGQTPDGAVAAEKMVTPAEVPQATQTMVDQGKQPVVTTPEAAVARRGTELANEQAPQSAETQAPTEAAPPEPTEAPQPKMGMYQPPKGKPVAVHVEEGAEAGKLRVRPLDSNGEPSERHVDVPADQVRLAEGSSTEAATPKESAPVKAGTEGPTEAGSPTSSSAPEPTKATNAPRNNTEQQTERSSEQAPTGPESREPAGKEQTPSSKTSEAKPTGEQTTAAKPAILTQLKESLAAHEKQETIPDGEKYAAGLAERQDNASAFANVLAQAAKASRGSAPDAAVDRAAGAARAAIGLTNKSAEATAKGRGTSHARVTAIVGELHAAARGLLGESRPGDEKQVSPKAAAIKERAAKKRAAASKPAEAAPELSPQEAKLARAREKLAAEKPAEAPKPAEKVQVPVGEKYKDQVAPEKLSEKDQRRLLTLKTAMVEAEDGETAAKHRSAIDEILHRMGRPPAEREAILKYLDNERAEKQKSGSMSDSAEEEEHVFERPESGVSTTYRPSPLEEVKARGAETRLTREFGDLARDMDERTDGKNSFFRSMARWAGGHISSHRVLDTLIQNTKTPILRDIIMHLREHMPDVPIHIVDEVKNLRNGEVQSGVGGLFSPRENVIQISRRVLNSETPYGKSFALRTIIHEMYHAASAHEIEDPNSKLAARMNALRDVLEDRLRARYGDDHIDAHLKFYNDRTGTVAKPDNFMRRLYGMTNAHEMLAEVFTNPDFVKEIAESEDWADPRAESKLFGIAPREGLLSRIYKAIGNFFGVKDPTLLQHIASTSQEVIESQAHRYGSNRSANEIQNNLPAKVQEILGSKLRSATPLELAQSMGGLRSITEEPEHLSNNTEEHLLRAFGDDDEPTKIARAFNHVVKGRAIDALRRTVIAVKTVGQIFRDHIKDFGSDGPGNPLRDLQEADIHKNVLINKLNSIVRPVAEGWARLDKENERKMSQLMIDSTMYRIDPRKQRDDQPASAKARRGYDKRYDDYVRRFNELSDEAKNIYGMAADTNARLTREMRRAGIDTALHTLGAQLNDAQKSLLYGIRSSKQYDTVIGHGKLIDIGENNEKLKAALNDFAGMTEIDGPYFHLGRQGDYVVAARPEGTREFDSPDKAEEWAQRVRELSPDSKATVAERGGKHVVDYKAQYVSMHETRRDAEAEQQRLVAAGFEPGLVTRKTLGRETAPLSHGLKELVAEAERKIQKNGTDQGTEALLGSIRSAFLQITAARSAYAGSRLARKNVGGVKAGDMMRNFAEHAVSNMWHAAQMRTVFDQAQAMSKLRAAARDNQADVPQRTMYRRGEVVDALNRHAIDEVQNYGHKSPLNSSLAKLGFMNFLASPSHAAIWMTQNFTTGIPVAGARWGYGRATAAFAKGMKVIGPGLRATMAEVMKRGDANPHAINAAILDYVRSHPELGKWAKGENSPLQQLIDRGVLEHGYSNELGAIARGDNPTVNRVMEWSRLLPQMADSFNRVSTALAGLEMTDGDVRKTADFVQEIHADYSQGNKPLAFKKINRLPGATTLTMFKTYAQEMTHLLYSNLKNSMVGENKAEAAKTFAGLLVGNSIFAGVYGGMAIAPLQLALYAYHKISDEEGETWDLKNAIHRFLVDHFGKGIGNTAAYGLPHVIGADVSSRMGLSDLFFHNPPDLLSSDIDQWKGFVYDQSGPMVQMVANGTTGFIKHMQRGEPVQAINSVIPVKAWQDAIKAYQLMTNGKVDSLGAQMTQPSVGDAVTQLLGFKPADVAEAQEKASTRIEMSGNIKRAKNDIIKQYVASMKDPDKLAEITERMNRFNKNFPANAIQTHDLQRMLRAQQEDEQGVNRNPDIVKATDF